MAEPQDNASDPSWFASPTGADAQAQSAPPPPAAADGFAGEKFGYHASNWLEAAPEAFPVAPQIVEVYSHQVNEINQGIADGSINGDDKEKFIELSNKYADIWDEYASRSAEATKQDNIDHLQLAKADVDEFAQNHPDLKQEMDSQSPSVETLKDAVDIRTDLAESNLDRANNFTHGLLDGAQIMLDFTREAAEIRSHQDGADTEALHDTLQKVDQLQSDIDNAHDAADADLDKNIDAVENWRDQSEHFIDAIPHPNQTSEGYRDDPKVSVNIASPDAAGQAVYAAQADVVVAYAALDDAHQGSAVTTAVADSDHGTATHEAVADAHGDDSTGAAADTTVHAHDASASATVEEASA